MGKMREDFVALGLCRLSFPRFPVALPLRALSGRRQFWPRNDYLKCDFLLLLFCGEGWGINPI